MWIVKRLILIPLLFFSMITVSAAQQLIVAVTPFRPPFVFKTANNHYYGFDISLMLHICKTIKRECVFKSMDFDDLLRDVASESEEIMIAISGITITPQRWKIVNFSKPYIPSECSYLTKAENADNPLTLDFLNEQRFGIEKGNIFDEVIRSVGINNAPISSYRNVHELIDALNRNNVSMIMLDTPSAYFWQLESKGQFKVIGKPFTCGYGMGIVVNKDEVQLLRQINQALDIYHQSEAYKLDYNRFINYKYMYIAE